jgi:hypothetical protein
MADRNPADRDILSDLAQIATGFGVLAIAAIGAMAAHKRVARPDLRPGSRSLNDILRQRPTPRRKPPEAGLAVPAVPPRGPLPMQGGAAAPLDFDV